MTLTEWARKEVELACKKENPNWDGELIKDSPQYLDLGIYEHCIDFDTNQMYVAYAEKTDYGYIARNIKEQQIK